MIKKIFALIIAFLFLTTNASFAFSDLYYLYNISEQQAKSIVKDSLQNLNYRLESENPYYAIYNKNPNDNAVIIIQQSGSNAFYYYHSPNKKNTELNQALLKTFKSHRINYEKQSNSSNIINVYDNIAQKTINSSGKSNLYTFDDDNYDNQIIYSSNQYSNQYSNNTKKNNSYNYSYNPQINSNKDPYSYNTNTQQVYSNNNNRYNNQYNNNTVYLPAYPAQTNVVQTNATTYSPAKTVNQQTTTQQATTLKGSVVSIETGTKIKTYLQNPINTSSANKGDKVIAVLIDDLRYNGTSVIPQGSLVYGTLSKARHATYGSRNGRVVIEFTQLVTPENKVYEISTEKIDFTVTNDGKVARTVGNAAAGAALGALTGLLFAALGDHNFGTAAAIGAGIGAGTALVGSGVERGVDAEIPSFTELELTLTKPFKVSTSY